jgi:protein-L-isoaspartate O-methyltransferase
VNISMLYADARAASSSGGLTLYGQDLVMLEKDGEGKLSRKTLVQVVYVPLLGGYGWDRS